MTRTRKTSGRITLRDVAVAAGVSPITVSRALRGQRQVAFDIAARVRDAANKLGYVPDPAARALASRRSSQVAVLIPMLANALFFDLVEGVQRVLLPAGYQTLVAVTHYQSSEEEQLLQSLLPHRPAGLLLTGFDRTEKSRRMVLSSGVPCVHLMETTDAPGVYSVGFSQADAGYALTEHLLQRGRRRVAYVAAQLDARAMQRAEGYRRCLREAGLYDPMLELLNPERSSIALGGQLFEELMRIHPEVDAIFYCHDDLAQGGLLSAQRMGIRVPDRVAITGFNDLPGSDQMLPPLTTVHTPRIEIGTQAAHMLVNLMRGEPVKSPRIDLGYRLVVRLSS